LLVSKILEGDVVAVARHEQRATFRWYRCSTAR
jgi:hypothetical protein